MAHILVADDEPSVLKLLGSRLQQAGHRVTLASDGKEALARISEDRPDVVFLDVMMPWMDGIEVLEALRHDSATRELPVIMLTPRTADVDALRGCWGSYEDHLFKPFDPRDAVARLDWVLRTHHPSPAVLLVHAPDPVRAQVYDALRTAGLLIAVADNGKQALDRATSFRPDLAIVGHRIRGIDGLAVLRRLRENPGTASLPVIVLLERETDADHLREWPHAPLYWLPHPISGDRLVEGIVQLCMGQNPSTLLSVKKSP